MRLDIKGGRTANSLNTPYSNQMPNCNPVIVQVRPSSAIPISFLWNRAWLFTSSPRDSNVKAEFGAHDLKGKVEDEDITQDCWINDLYKHVDSSRYDALLPPKYSHVFSAVNTAMLLHKARKLLLFWQCREKIHSSWPFSQSLLTLWAGVSSSILCDAPGKLWGKAAVSCTSSGSSHHRDIVRLGLHTSLRA